MPSFSVYTLGCKLNQVESEAVADAFKRAGWDLVPWDPVPGEEDRELLIVNTCTVTSKAEQKARRIIRRALEGNPRSRVIVTGCYAQLEGERIAALEGKGGGGRLLVVPGDRKSLLLDLPGRWPPGGTPPLPLTPRGAPEGGRRGEFRLNPENFSFHSRPFLKIQEGCDNRCSFCRVSLARGESRSFGAEQVLALLKALEKRGAGEAVLTGVNINQYAGADGRDLAGLIRFLLEGTERICLRLSSLEPDGLGPELLAVLAHPRLRPHFHLSLQSGSPLVLERMRRAYGPGEVERGVARLRSLREDPFLGCDLITGFPGETAEEFDKTEDLCRRLDFAGIHAFPYSPRPGTEAFGFRDRVSEREAAARRDRLLELARQGRRDYVNRWIGRELDAVFEAGFPGDFRPGGDGEARPAAALSDNYLKLRLPPGVEVFPGRPLRCRLLALPPGEGGPFDAAAEPVA